MDLTNYPHITIDDVPGIYVLFNSTGDPSDLNGPVTTQEDVDAFVPGYGHMYDGVIKRYGATVCDRNGWHFVTEVAAQKEVE